MPVSSTSKFTLNDLRAARKSGRKVPMLTCYDYTMARIMQRAGVPALLVGDSASNVILGHPTTLPISLDFQIEITAAVRRGAPDCLLMADMPFGSYQASIAFGVKNVCRMVQLSGCDCVKLEVAKSHAALVKRLTDAGVAIVAHLGLRPQSVGLSGYKAQGRTAGEARDIVKLARKMEKSGAVAILLEAVPPIVGQAVVEAVEIPVIGCGAGPACHGHVVVTHDLLGWSGFRPRFVPDVGDRLTPLLEGFKEYVKMIESGEYPNSAQNYEIPDLEKSKIARELGISVKSAKKVEVNGESQVLQSIESQITGSKE
jgi:3-methyl-2-oxobutanoate hydroxymethyltransferase